MPVGDYARQFDLSRRRAVFTISRFPGHFEPIPLRANLRPVRSGGRVNAPPPKAYWHQQSGIASVNFPYLHRLWITSLAGFHKLSTAAMTMTVTICSASLWLMETMTTDPRTARTADASGRRSSYRVTPHNAEAEQELLGAILTNNKAYEKVGEFLKPEHFYDPVHSRIFETIHTLVQRGEIADPVTLKAYFENDPALESVGGAGYLGQLAGSVVSVVNSEHYGRIIHDMYLRRQLIDMGEDMVNEAYSHNLEGAALEQIEGAEKKLFDLATTGDIQGGFQPFSQSLRVAIDMAEEAFKRDSQVTGVTTGLIDLDRKLGGLHPSDLLILAGRPSMGKTALATNIAFAAAKAHMRTNGSEGAGVAFFSLEMSAEQLATRILADEAQVASEKIRRGDLKPEDFQRFSEASSILSRVPFYVDDTPALSIAAVRTRARRLARTSRQSGPDRGRLSPIAARHGRQEQRKPGAGSLRDHPRAEGHRQGTGCAGRGAVPAFPRGRAA